MLTVVASLPGTAHLGAAEPSLRRSIRKCAKHLAHALALAAIAEPKDPERAARYIADTMRDLKPQLRRILAASHTDRP